MNISFNIITVFMNYFEVVDFFKNIFCLICFDILVRKYSIIRGVPICRCSNAERPRLAKVIRHDLGQLLYSSCNIATLAVQHIATSECSSVCMLSGVNRSLDDVFLFNSVLNIILF